MQHQGQPFIAETTASQQDQSERDATSEAESEIRYYAHPELLTERCRHLEKIPFVLVEPEPRSELSKRRARKLEEEFREALRRGQKPRLELQSTILGGPLIGGWPKIEEEDSDIEYPLCETEAEWHAWKRETDEKRALKRQMAAAGVKKATGIAGPSKPIHESTVAKTAGFSQTFSGGYARDKENGEVRSHKSSRTVAPETEWNENSMERAVQSTPVRQEGTFVPTPHTPRNRAQPPNQLRATTSSSDARSAMLSQRNMYARTNQAMTPSLHPPQITQNADRLRRQDKSFVSHALSFDSLLRTPVSPAHKPNTPLVSPSNGIMSRESVENWRRRTTLVESQEEGSQRGSSQHPQDYVASQTTTHYLYGSQDGSPPSAPLQIHRSNSYMRELEEELERERKIFDFDKAVNGYSMPKRVGTWNVAPVEEDTRFESQEAMAISHFVEEDLGNPYRDEPYAAFNPIYDRYQNPYDDY